jgi:GNAT superfamily N-acetyltransferase
MAAAVTGDRLQFRKATEADLPALLALHAEPGLDDEPVLALAQAQALFRRIRSYPSYSIYLALDQGAVVGTFALLIMDNLAHLGAPSAVVEDVLVAAHCRGAGIGTAMMRFALEVARQYQCYKLTLSSNLKRERAHAFYDKLGFERHGYSFRVRLGADGER